jgi:hypothetical protein
VLGEAAFAALPAPLRALHAAEGRQVFVGEGAIRRGRHPLVAPLAWAARLPPSADTLPVQVTFLTDAAGERWQRRFGAHPMQSRLWHHHGRLRERLGAVRFEFGLDARDGEIHWRVTRVWALGVLPLPLRWFGGVRCRERARAGRYEFLVDVRLPWIGPLIRYEGWLAPR